MSINKIEYFDTIIIGAGAGLTNLAIPASNYNKKICIIEVNKIIIIIIH